MEKNQDVLIGYSDYFEEKDGHKISCEYKSEDQNLDVKNHESFSC